MMDASISEEENLFNNNDDVQENDEISKLLAENQSSRHEVWRKKITATFALMCVLFGKNVSMVMPIFPMLALPKGIGPGQQSFVFIVPDMVGTVAMIFWGKVMPRLGLKFTLVVGWCPWE